MANRQFLKPSPLPSVVGDRRAQQSSAELDARRGEAHATGLPANARVLEQCPYRDDVLMETTALGRDYFLVCGRHQWASPAVTLLEYVGCCPFCLCELDETRGRQRYAVLQAAVIRVGR
jgi:hypothetical protein